MKKMVKKKKTTAKKKTSKKAHSSHKKKIHVSHAKTQLPETMSLVRERDIAMDFGMKVYAEFDQMVKAVVLFGSSAKKKSTASSDIDLLIIIDDVSVRWDMELVAWYREELQKLIKTNPYIRPLHVNTMKLTTWWDDLMKGDPVVLNVLRYGDPIVDFGGFFTPLKVLMTQGRIRSTPEAVYTLLQRAPRHMARARQSLLAAVDGLYWTMIDSAHAALISLGVEPASPEDVPGVLHEVFVSRKALHKKYVGYFEEVHKVAKEIIHGKRVKITGKELDYWSEIAEEFMDEMARLIDDILKDQLKE